MKASMAIQVLPKTENEKELLRIVDSVIEIIANSGLNYVVGPFESTVEGDSMDEILDLLKLCHEKCLTEGAESVSCYVKLHQSKSSILSIDDKIGKYS